MTQNEQTMRERIETLERLLAEANERIRANRVPRDRVREDLQHHIAQMAVDLENQVKRTKQLEKELKRWQTAVCDTMRALGKSHKRRKDLAARLDQAEADKHERLAPEQLLPTVTDADLLTINITPLSLLEMADAIDCGCPKHQGLKDGLRRLADRLLAAGDRLQ